MKFLRMLLTPAVHWMHRLRYPYKFAAIGRLGARYGGEESAFIAPNCDEAHARNLAAKINHALQSLAMPQQLSEFGHVTVSIGIAIIVPSGGDSPDCLVKAADAALYRAKEQGRNRAVFDSEVCAQAPCAPSRICPLDNMLE